MKDLKNSLIFYKDWQEIFELLSPEECKELIIAIMSFDGKVPQLSRQVQLASVTIFKQMVRDDIKWKEVRKKRRVAGSLGGKKTQSQANQANASSGNSSKSSKRVANQAVNVNVNVNGNVNVNEYIATYVADFNKLFNSKYQVTDGRKTKLAARLKKYSFEDIQKALVNLSKSEWHTGKNDSGWTADPDFLIRKDERIDKWLNVKVTKKQEWGDLI